jgi:transcriptional regulator with XRE-family HTH domain
MAEIGKRIRDLRKEKNLTQQELSEKLNVSRSAVANWEGGRNYPDLDSIISLSDLLDISLD